MDAIIWQCARCFVRCCSVTDGPQPVVRGERLGGGGRSEE